MKYYVRRQFHEEKLGPFETINAADQFISEQTRKEPYWDYDVPGFGYWDEFPKMLEYKKVENIRQREMEEEEKFKITITKDGKVVLESPEFSDLQEAIDWLPEVISP
jgi:hypothetical protein